MTKTIKKPTTKLYCYVDETGQDTAGQFFLVSVIVTGEERDGLIRELEIIEKGSHKGISKWKKTSLRRRSAYIEELIQSEMFVDKICYSIFHNSRDYQEMTIDATARAIISTARLSNYEASVYVDGLNKDDRSIIGAGLRHRYIRVKKVRGLSDESNALIRLADAIAGFVRDNIEGSNTMETLYKKAVSRNLIKKLEK